MLERRETKKRRYVREDRPPEWQEKGSRSPNKNPRKRRPKNSDFRENFSDSTTRKRSQNRQEEVYKREQQRLIAERRQAQRKKARRAQATSSPRYQSIDSEIRRPKAQVKTAPKQSSGKASAGKSKKKSLAAVIIQPVYTVIFYVFTLGIILTAVLFALNSNENASLYGYRFYTVMTNSMVPVKGQTIKGLKGFYAQDVIIVKNTPYDQIEKNDVVTYKLGNDKSYLTHRVVEKTDHVGEREGEFLITKGDANKTKDPPVTADRLVGKAVFVIPYVGYILEFIREYFWLCLVFVLGLFGSLLVLKMYFFGK